MQTTVFASGQSQRQVPECQVTSFQALCTAFRHAALTSDPKLVCSLLQSCKSWRAALQQCGAGNMIVDLGGARQLQELANFSSFAYWIPKHAGLLAEIHLVQNACGSRDWQTSQIMEQMLALALQSTGATNCLRLKTFSTSCICSAAVLEALPAAYLTRLDMSFSSEAPEHMVNSAAVALRRLTNLHQLSLNDNVSARDAISHGCLASVGQLCCLTNLKFDFVHAEANLALLPAQLQRLDYCGTCGTMPLLLGHLTALREVELYLWNKNSALGLALPSQVTSLSICSLGGDGKYNNLNFSGLHQLQHLFAHNCLHDAQQLQQLASLPQLQHVELHYVTPSQACSTAPAWKYLTPKLRCISIRNSGMGLSMDDSRALLEGLSAATSLIHLSIGKHVQHQGVSVGMYLARLQQLQQLRVTQTRFAGRADALHLTALTALTNLQIQDAAAVDDTVATALAYRLTQLQELRLTECGLRSPAALPVIAGLSRLRVLDLSGYPGHMSDQDVMLLTSLTGLQRLTADRTFSRAAVDRFWAAVRGE